MSNKLLIVGAVLFILISSTVNYVILSYPENTESNINTTEETNNLQNTQQIRAIFVGDIMLDRGVAKHAELYGTSSIFVNVRSLFEGNDLTVGNLEGTITSQDSVSKNNSGILRFTFNPQLASYVLKSLGFTAVSLANNHTLDFGQSGYEETKENLIKNVILSFGSPSNGRDLSVQVNIKGKQFCLVGYEEFINSDPQPIIDEINSLESSCYQIIVLPHWGIEYDKNPSDKQKALAHEFIDAGADIIIGSHPHVVQPLEIYKNKAIFYSLGNFIFDQDFSFETTHGLAVQIDFSDAETHFALIPLSISHSEVSFASSTAEVSDFSLFR